MISQYFICADSDLAMIRAHLARTGSTNINEFKAGQIAAVMVTTSWLRHPTFQRIFGRAEEARGAGPSLGLPLSAITSSAWSPEFPEVKALFKAPREDGSRFRAELDCS